MLRPGTLPSLPPACRGAAHRLLDLVLPPQCLACGAPLAGAMALCGSCWQSIDFIRAPLCPVSGRPLAFDAGGPRGAPLGDRHRYARARAVARHDGAARTLVHALKYRDRVDLARPMACWMAAAGRELLEGADLLVPVPLHRWRLWQRRYNQAARLAHWIGRQHGIVVRHDLLSRGRRTRPQVGLTSAQRRRNVAGAFRLAAGVREHLAGRRVVLVDDVITTGATCDACARCLLAGGATAVDVLAFAIVAEAT